MLENIKRFIWKKPNKDYIKWLFPQNKNSLGNGLIFTLITVSALSLVDSIFYAELFKEVAEKTSSTTPTKEFETDNFFRLILAPIINILAIFLAKSDWNNSMKRHEWIAAFVLFFYAFSFLLSGIYNEYYTAGNDYSYDLLVLILFSQTLFGLTYRTSFFFNSTLVLAFFIYLLLDDDDTKEFVFALTLVLLVWIPVLSNTFKLERARLTNFKSIFELEQANLQISKQKDLLKAGEIVSRMGAWHASPDLQTINYSDGVYAIYGLEKVESSQSIRSEISDKIFELIHPDDKQKIDEIIKMLSKGIVTPFTEHRIRFPNGKVKWVKITSDEQSLGRGYIGTVQDITKDKLLEIALQNHTDELKLKNEELQQFVYASSHDLQEPLRSISNFVGLLNKKLGNQLKPEHKLFMEIILNSTVRMKQLIHAILDYSRIGRDKSLEHFDVNEVVSNLLTDLHFSIEESKGIIHSNSLPMITGYRTEFSLLLQNLIGNALKFRREEVNPIIYIRSFDAKNEFQFCVEDNGIGINPKYAKRIFQLFSRLHTTEEYEGTGIGLTHCKKIVELHGGKIWVESTKNKGTMFYFTIPKNIVAI